MNNQAEPKTFDDGKTFWYLNGVWHREGGPALEYPSGLKHWYLNGIRHREGGPAIEFPDGTKKWYFNDKLHREGGPAVEYSNGIKRWFLNGKEFSFGDYFQELRKLRGEDAVINLLFSLDAV
jgi:hypothetical protein